MSDQTPDPTKSEEQPKPSTASTEVTKSEEPPKPSTTSTEVTQSMEPKPSTTSTEVTQSVEQPKPSTASTESEGQSKPSTDDSKKDQKQLKIEKKKAEQMENETKLKEERKNKRTMELRKLSAVTPFLSFVDEVGLERYGYQIHRHQTVGQGVYSTVYKARKKDKRETLELSVKMVVLERLPQPYRQNFVDNALRIVKFVGKKGHKEGEKEPIPMCEHFVKVYEIFMIQNKAFIFMEEVLPLSMYTRIKTKDTITEYDAKKWGKQLAEAIDYLQVAGIAHRNIRTENVIFSSKMNIKLVGFGSAIVFWNDETKQSISVPKEKPLKPALAVKLDHLPPNCLKGDYDPSHVDLWGWGVFVCLLIHKQNPFDVNSDKTAEEQWNAYSTKYQFSIESKHLLDRCFQQRVRSYHILDHKWLNDGKDKKKVKN